MRRALMEPLRADEQISYQVGAGVHSGVAFVGALGTGSHVDMTAMGDPVNVTARLASAAGPGEIPVSADAAGRAQLETSPLDSRELELKGKSQPTRVFVVA